MIYEICPIDESDDNCFFQEEPDGKLTIRGEYMNLECQIFGKIDEIEAISCGISSNFVIKSTRDLISTSDDVICVTQKFRDVIKKNKINGLKFISIPNDQEHFIVICTCLAKTDKELAGFDYRGKCDSCGRYKEILIGPLIRGMEIPKQQLTFFASEIANENVKVSYRPIFAAEPVVKLLKKEKIKGIDYMKAL